MPTIQHLPLRLAFSVAALWITVARGQEVNIGLYQTAVPDSFEVRMASTGASFTSVPNASFTVRWDASAGGSITGQDVASACGAFQLFPNGPAGVVVHGPYAYYTFIVLSIRPLGEECPITSDLESIGGFRIQGLSGCRRVEIVTDPSVVVNNATYWISMGGLDVTGEVLTGPLSYGDCPPCEPPVILSATADQAFPGAPVHVAAAVNGTDTWQIWGWTANGPLLSYALVDTVITSSPNVFFAVWNSCGMDEITVPVALDSSFCTGPPNVQEVFSQWQPGSNELILWAQVQANGVCTYEWLGPVAINSTVAQATLNNAPSGTYQLIATNYCGSDSGYVSVVADTTGIGSCVPPVIDSLTTNSPVCDGQQLVMHAYASGTGPSLFYDWDGPGLVYYPDGSPTCTANAYVTGTYSLILSNACGSDTATTQVQFSGPGINAVYHVICGADSSFLLNDLVPNLPPGLPWQLDGLPHSNIYDPAVDTSGTYEYVVEGLGYCMNAVVDIVDLPLFSAGTDGSVTLCSTDDPISLIDYLGGQPDPGGHWVYAPMASSNGVYNPAQQFPGVYMYYHGLCGDTIAHVFVAEIEAAVWYADNDDDGLGDPATITMSCDQPVGYLTDSTDLCPSLVGTVGSPCDDGLPFTYSDVIDSTCVCTGELILGTLENATNGASLHLWPNPLRSGETFLHLGNSGSPIERVVLFNALGAEVATYQSPRPDATGTVTLRTPTSLAAGIYTVVSFSHIGEQRVKLVVE